MALYTDTLADRLAMIPPEERRHLLSGPRSGESPTGVALLGFLMKCEDSSASLELMREVLLAIIDCGGPPWPEVERWRLLLPRRFVDSCAPEPSEQEIHDQIVRWRALSEEEKIQDEELSEWSLDDWLYWLQPENRDWFWWDSTVLDDRTLQVQIELAGLPAPTGALKWLMKSTGVICFETYQP